MITLLGNPKRTCTGITRRDALTAGGLSLLGMTLPDLLRAEQSRPSLPRDGKAKSVILIYLFGGPPLHDTFDPKPQAPVEIRGEFGSTPTSVPGVHFCELLPQMAKWMNRSTLIRSAAHPHNDHSAGLLYTLTGKRAARLESAVPVLPTQAPSMNSVIQYLARDEKRELPASVWMPCYTGWGQATVRPGPYAGFLGRQYEPFFTSTKAHSGKECKYAYPERVQGQVVLPEMNLPEDISLDRLDRRRSLVQQFNDELRRAEQTQAADRLDLSRRQAFDLLTSANRPNSPWRAFGVEGEDARLQDRYGRNSFGWSLLMARRLVAAGVNLVQVNLGNWNSWDTHGANFPKLKDFLLPPTDRAVSALLDDLRESGLLDDTLIVMAGEFGRTPKISLLPQHYKLPGRDHWGGVQSVFFAGGGVEGSRVVGSSDSKAAYPASDPKAPENMAATIYHALGIPTGAAWYDGQDRPNRVYHSEPIKQLFA